jgi:hypothetical protein
MTTRPTTIAYDLAIGVDPGVRTGFAVWDIEKQRLIQCETRTIISAMQQVRWQMGSNRVLVVFEDARQRGGRKEAAMGAGSVRRDSGIWEEFCDYYKIKYEAVAPTKGATKWTDAQFKAATKWEGRTSQHARDAALLVIGRGRKVAA